MSMYVGRGPVVKKRLSEMQLLQACLLSKAHQQRKSAEDPCLGVAGKSSPPLNPKPIKQGMMTMSTLCIPTECEDLYQELLELLPQEQQDALVERWVIKKYPFMKGKITGVRLDETEIQLTIGDENA